MVFSFSYHIIMNCPFFPDPNQGQRLIQGQPQGVRMMSAQGMVPRPPLAAPTATSEPTVPTTEPSEIPDNVTAELEKLEQEGAPMSEVEGVGAIFDGLDDDDELFGERAVFPMCYQ